MRRSLGIGLTGALLLSVAGLIWGQAPVAPGFFGTFDLKSLEVEGLSAVWITPDGRKIIALSDRSYAVTATIERDAAGMITAVHSLEQTLLQVRKAQKSVPGLIDSEGIAVGPKGEVFVSTEGPARVMRFDSLDGEPVQIGRPRDFGKLDRNGALEALAIGPTGTLYALAETDTRDPAPHKLFANAGAGWSVLATLPRQGDFLPVGADVGPDGRLYVLYRSFSALRGFAALLARHDLGPGTLGPAQTLIETEFGQHGNLEGVSIWRDARGRLTATMITDDNGNMFQSAELVEYHLPD